MLESLCIIASTGTGPGIYLSNMCSLCNEQNELQLLVGKTRDFSSSSILCFTETWPCGLVVDFRLQLQNFQFFSADHDTEFSNKAKCGGTCFYINSGWSNDVTVIPQQCSANPSAPLVGFNHSGQCLHSTASKHAGGTACSLTRYCAWSGHTWTPQLLSLVTLTKDISTTNFPNTNN